MSKANFDAHAQPSRPILFDSIPLRLRAGRQHVLWKREQRKNGDIGKVPYIAFSALAGKAYPAKVSNSRTWSNFTQTRHAYERGGWDGVGYVLDEGVILVDLDHCIHARGEIGEIDPRAQEIMDLLNSSAELSPGRDGIHIYLLGQLPEGTASRYAYKGFKIEVYGTGRYTTLTGAHLDDTPKDLQERTAELAMFLKQCQIIQEENTGGVCGGVPGAIPGDQAQRPRQRSARASTTSTRATRTTGAGLDHQVQAIVEADLTLGEQGVLQKARAAKNGATFDLLWQGGDPRDRRKANGSPDQSAGDFDLALMLCYWTNEDREQIARLFRASRRYRQEKGAAYLERTIEKAITKRHYKRRATEPPEPDPGGSGGPRAPLARQPAHQDRRITHVNTWTKVSETPEQRAQLLQETARRVAEEVDAHIRGNCFDTILVEGVAPGIGKTHATSELGVPGTGLKLAWIAERRDMAAQVPALQTYRLIDPCTRHNCPDHLLHEMLGSKSLNTMAVHKRHQFPCGYVRQFDGTDSAVYQLAHVKTKNPAKADGIIIDELDLSKWLPEREIPIRLLKAALVDYPSEESTANRMIHALQVVITDCMLQAKPLHGRGFFEALNQLCGGRLAAWLAELRQDSHYSRTHPWPTLDEDDDMAQQWVVEQMLPVVFPHIFVALDREQLKWQSGTDWNSYLRVGKGREGWALFITEPLQFSSDDEGNLPARAVLDATAPDEEILSLVLGAKVEIHRAEVAPPPGTRHIAMRLGKRYGLTSLCATPHDKDNGKPLPNRYMLRAVAEIRYLLRELDPDGAIHARESIGLVTFKGCEGEIGDELGIPEHRRLHFWAARGSNQLADCDLLFVVGTPQQNPASVERLARVIWANDPTPIDPTPRLNETGNVAGYKDPRVDKLNRYLIRAELTQCAHRSRALRQARTVVTLCLEEIDYLPATETIIDLPMLSSAGLDAWKLRRQAERERLDQARQSFEEAGKTIHMISVRAMRAAANCSTDTARAYLRQARKDDQIQEEQALARERARGQAQHTHTLCSPTAPENVPALLEEYSYSQSGTNIQEAAARAAPVDPADVIMAYARATGYAEVQIEGVHIGPGAGSWGRFMWRPGASTSEQRQAICAHIQGQPPRSGQSGPPRLAG